MNSSRHILARPAWLAGPRNAVWIAALSLVAIQVGIGIIMKSAQTGGTYSFSPSASIVISEFLKMLLSTAFFYRVCQRRTADGILPSTRIGGSGYRALDSELPMIDHQSNPAEREKEAPNKVEDLSAARPHQEGPLPYLTLGKYWSYVRGEISGPVRVGFCNLSLFYVLINNSVCLFPTLLPDTMLIRVADLCRIQDGGSRNDSTDQEWRHIDNGARDDYMPGCQAIQDTVDCDCGPGELRCGRGYSHGLIASRPAA
jgi:hypothetical protein